MLKKVVIVVLVFLFLELATWGILYFRSQRELRSVSSFEECSGKGYLVLESYPEQCRTPDGRTFVRKLSVEEKEKIFPPTSGFSEKPYEGEGKSEKSCQNLCGDGICQEIVCMAVGCPCSEDKNICPGDCK